MKEKDVVGAFFEDDWFGGYGACDGLWRQENMVVVVVVVAVDNAVGDADGFC